VTLLDQPASFDLPVRVEPEGGAPGLVDGFGRVHRDLRVSLTDRCQLRCTYCLPEEYQDWLPGDRLLTADEIVEVVATAVDLGVRTVRLTGGEPLLRPDVVDIVAGIAALPQAPEVAMTTNGLRLAALAGPLAAAGLTRVNVSLDTLDPDTFRRVTGRARLDDVLEGLAVARAVGLSPVKVNTVLVPGLNDHEALALLRRALDEGWSLRFIEQMPLGADRSWTRDSMVTADRVLGLLRPVAALTPVPARGSAPAQEWLVDGGPATVGIVASVTRPFCGDCDRLRLTADGQVRNCLFARTEQDLLPVLRGTHPYTDAIERRRRIAAVLTGSVAAKQPGHGVGEPGFVQPARPMSAIGG
jgi:cyclic pyranopterin phosphate synthase